jgi:uncharacterized LabA/DUF88 family protein
VQRVSFFIDGFNVYHKINEYQEITGICYKWLNYKSLLSSFLQPDQTLKDIYFFTAISRGRGPESVNRHNKYITALKNIGIIVITGRFITTTIECRVRNCNFSGNRNFNKEQEKKTDVNLAINMVLDACNNEYDKCFLLSSDSDFVPALDRVREMGKNVGLLVPPQDKKVNTTPCDQLRYACRGSGNKIINLKFDMLRHHLLPEIVIDPKTSIPVRIPNEYMTSGAINKIFKE